MSKPTLVDANNPNVVVIPSYGPDGQSRRYRNAGFLWSSSLMRAIMGVGVQRPDGGQLMGHTNALLQPQQSFFSAARPIANPALLNTPDSMSFPGTSVPTDTRMALVDGWPE